MGYPMTYQRVISRNQLHNGGYEMQSHDGALRGDLRRLEQDALIPRTDQAYSWPDDIAKRAGVDCETAIRVLRAFFEVDTHPNWTLRGGWPDQNR